MNIYVMHMCVYSYVYTYVKIYSSVTFSGE